MVMEISYSGLVSSLSTLPMLVGASLIDASLDLVEVKCKVAKIFTFLFGEPLLVL